MCHVSIIQVTRSMKYILRDVNIVNFIVAFWHKCVTSSMVLVVSRRGGRGGGHWVLWIKLVLESTINIYHFRSMGHSMGLVRIALVGQHISSVNGQLSRWNNSGNCWKGSHSILTLVTKCWLVFGSRGQYCG